jgi:hypothetical protein
MKKITLFTFLITLLFLCSGKTFASKFLIGTSSVDITPALPSAVDGQMTVRIAREAETPLSAQIIVLEAMTGNSSKEVSVFVSCDLVTIPTELKQLIQESVKKAIPGLDEKKIMINATHTHTAGAVRDGWYTLPEGVTKVKDYQEFIAEQVTKAIVKAWENRQPGSVAWGLGYAKVAFNRRAIYENGTAQMYGKTDVPEFRGIEGYEDQSVGSLFFWNEAGKLLAVCINVASPAQIVESRSVINADYWHPLREFLKKEYGPDLCVLGWIGAAGDQTPRPMFEKEADKRMVDLANGTYSREGKNREADFRTNEYLQEIAGRIFDTVNQTYELVKNDQHMDVPILHEVKEFTVAARTVTQAEKEAAEKNIAEDKKDKEKAVLYSRRIAWNQEVIDRFEKQNPDTPTQYQVETHIIRIGDVAICTNPFELFTEFGVQIKARSKALQTFVVQLVGPGTYVPTKKAEEGGHYSAIVQSNRVGHKGGQQLVDNTVGLINNLW